MVAENYVPQATLDALQADYPPGTRHAGMFKIALPLLGNGKTEREVFAILRAKFSDEDKSDKEIEDVIRWSQDKHPTPSGFGDKPKANGHYKPALQNPPAAKPKPPAEHAAWWLNGKELTENTFSEQSEIQIPDDRTTALKLFLDLLYQGSENINVVLAHETKKEKANPIGAGVTATRDKWLGYITKKFPEKEAGAWVRPNPVAAKGSGSGGAIADSDVTTFRFLLVESDTLTLPVQLALFSKLRLPIAAVIKSGGVSAHAWVRMDCPTVEDYDAKCRKILSLLAPFGIDQCNKNPSRLSRLPCAIRKIGAHGDGVQRLLWLNPSKEAVTSDGIADLENLLKVPVVDEKPFSRLMVDSVDRFQNLYDNRGKLGVPTGFVTFDRISGGLKPGGYTIISGLTGSGKSTVALNMTNAALKAGYGAVLFSLELNREDVADMFFAMNCEVDRNRFNTGEFTEDDFKRLALGASKMQSLPLWIDDDPTMKMEAIEQRVLSLKADGRIGLAVVDYAQLVTPDFPESHREQAVASIALGLRVLSRRANIPIIVLSQLNDDGRLRESRRLAHEAANVFRIERKSLSDPNITLFIDKGRKIPSKPINLFLNAQYCTVRELSRVEDSSVPGD